MARFCDSSVKKQVLRFAQADETLDQDRRDINQDDKYLKGL